MKTLFLAALLAGGSLASHSLVHAHGGTYTGPADTVPPAAGGAFGGGSGGTPGSPAGPTTPRGPGPSTGRGGIGAQPGNGAPVAITGARSSDGIDLTQWGFWWEFNKQPYLQLKASIHSLISTTGSDDWFLGDGGSLSKDTWKPSEQQIREVVVPALLAALEKETHNDAVTGCLIALAKIGDPAGEGTSAFGPVFERFLADANQEISETAAVALGILGSSRSIGTLEALLLDSPSGRKLVGGDNEVPYRTRAFAAYGLGLVGHTAAEPDRARVVALLRNALESRDTSRRDVAVSCIIAMGLVPLDTIASADGTPAPAETSRLAQLDFLLAFLRDESRSYLVRAHCPTALARLIRDLPEPHHALWRERIADDLIARIAKDEDQTEIVQSSVLALGLLGTNDGAAPLDRKIREVLAAVPKDVNDHQARRFALIALARAGGEPGAHDPDGGVDETRKALLDQLVDGKEGMKPWAGLACGVLGHRLEENGGHTAAVASLQRNVRQALESERNSEHLGAYALAAGILGDVEATPLLLARLDSEKTNDALGYVAVALGLLGAREEATERIQRLVDTSKYRPDLLKRAAIALGLLGDKELVPKLTALLAESTGMATQAALSTALGTIGDSRSIEPLVRMLQNQELLPGARGFAAAALGIVADKEALPWNSKIGVDLNYRAATETLTNPAGGTGILDIL